MDVCGVFYIAGAVLFAIVILYFNRPPKRHWIDEIEDEITRR